jgi:hypothetical protein
MQPARQLTNANAELATISICNIGNPSILQVTSASHIVPPNYQKVCEITKSIKVSSLIVCGV